jgi:hypothetical protein
MKLSNLLAGAIALAIAGQALGQTTPPPKTASQTLASSEGLQVYPSKGQDAGKQAMDEAECYKWSKEQTGYDPANPPPVATAAKVEAPPAQPTGARARGAVRGAAAGAVVGEIANNDADEGARAGAAAGVVAGGVRNRQARRAQEAQVDAANQQAQAAADQANAQRAQLQASFKKGMGACLEGRGYTVK